MPLLFLFESSCPIQGFLLSCVFLLWEPDNFSTDKIMNHRGSVIVKDKYTSSRPSILGSEY